jgi:CRP-like cAMP-binding protein
MSLLESLARVQLFTDLSQDELERIATLCQPRICQKGDLILSEGETSRELFIISRGTVEVSLLTQGATTPLVNLGTGQIFGEMALVDRGARSATVTAIAEETELQVILHEAFLDLCERDEHVGFIVMRNLAAEMSLRLRLRNIERAKGTSA